MYISYATDSGVGSNTKVYRNQTDTNKHLNNNIALQFASYLAKEKVSILIILFVIVG